MKIKLFILLTMIGTIIFSGSLELRNGSYFGGKYHTEKEELKTKFPVFELGVEYRKEITDNFELGGGILFQYQKRIKETDIDGFNSYPVYIAVRYNFYENSKIKTYMKSDIGYSYNSGNFKNGIYYGTGIGIQYNKITWDIMYKRNNSTYKNSGNYNGKFDYDRLSITSGYVFSF